jgi:hypothetical protein
MFSPPVETVTVRRYLSKGPPQLAGSLISVAEAERSGKSTLRSVDKGEMRTLSSCHGIVGCDGTRRRTCGRSTVIGFGSGFGSDFGAGAARRSIGANVRSARRFSKVRCGFTSRASAASLTASTYWLFKPLIGTCA